MQSEFEAELLKTQNLHEAELLKTQNLHKTELQEIKRQYEEMIKSPKSSFMPKQVEMEEVEVQVSVNNIS